MQDPKFLSPQMVSELLKVSCSTVKRWVDEGRLNAAKTFGGHRKILVDDVIKLAKENNWHHITLEKIEHLSGGDTTPANCRTVFMNLYQAIREGNQEKVRMVLIQAFRAGLTITDIGDQVVVPAMYGLGEDWSRGDVDICQEHHATQGVLAALMEIRQSLLAAQNPKEKAPLAMGCAAEGDHYLLPTLLLELLFLESRWRVVHFGPNTPLDSLLKKAIEQKPKVIWISATHLVDPYAFKTQVKTISSVSASWQGDVYLGGQAIDTDTPETWDRAIVMKSLAEVRDKIRKTGSSLSASKTGRFGTPDASSPGSA